MTKTQQRKDFLSPVAGPQVWFGPEIAKRSEIWTHTLSRAEIEDIERATEAALALGRDIVEITAEDFPIRTAKTSLSAIRKDLLEGRGFVVIRGLPIENYSIEESAVAFWGLGLHLGEPVSQNGKGHVLGHVKNLGLNYDDPLVRGYQTSARLPYHTDYSDLVALLCLKTAKAGGLSSIASSVTLYDEMLRRRPDLAAVLTRPLYRTRWGEIGAGLPPWVAIPAFNPYAGGVSTTYVRSAVKKAQLIPETPRLTDQQNEAMDFFDALAADPAIHLDIEFAQGDIQIVNNHWIVHSRTAYEDHDRPEDRRHLLRLWLACMDGPPFPPGMSKQFQGLTKNGRPNGIHVPGVPFNAPLKAV